MDKELKLLLKSCAKDDNAYSELEQVFEKLVSEKETYQKYLELLEASIKNDYDSILITELTLEKPGPKIVYVNDGFTKMTGYSREEAIGKTPRILQGPKTDRSTLDKLRKNLEEGRSFFGQTVNYRKDGSEFINQWDIHPLISKDGNITHWVSYQHDITERKKAEQTIFEADTDVNDAYESSKRTIVDVDSRGKMIFANKAFRELTGYTREELSKMSVWELMPNKQQAVFSSHFEQLWNNPGQGEEKRQFILRCKNGTPIQVEFSFKKMSLDGGEMLRIDVKNLSLRKKVMEKLQKQNSSFAQIFSVAREFDYGMKLNNEQFEFNWLSETIQRIAGYKENELEGPEGLHRLIKAEDMALAKAHYNRALTQSSSCETFRIVTKAGDEIMVMDYAKNDGENSIKGTTTLV